MDKASCRPNDGEGSRESPQQISSVQPGMEAKWLEHCHIIDNFCK